MKEPAAYPYTAGIAFFVTPIPRYAEEIRMTIGHLASHSTRNERFRRQEFPEYTYYEADAESGSGSMLHARKLQ